MFNPSEYAGSVGCIHAGFPCQDISVAGKQAGVSEGTRSGLYREVLRIAGVVRPKYLFLENVSAILGNGLGTVLGDMAALGYDVKWLCIRASDVGAPHHRDRWFALAYTSGNGGERRRECESGSTGTEQHTEGQRSIADIEAQGRSENVAYADSAQRKGNECTQRSNEKYTDIGGAGWWSTEPNVGRVANGVSSRVAKLKALGNAQVPLQAATAWCLLGGPIG